MRNVARLSNSKIKIDWEKSKESYLYDSVSGRSILDFFGMYASLPLGYNHPIFENDFEKEIVKASKVKITNCEFLCEESESFDKQFTEFAGQGFYKNIHYCSTGALAVESALKAVLVHRKFPKNPKFLTLKNSFHGANSYGGFLTSRFFPVNKKLDFFPRPFCVEVEANLTAIKAAIKSGIDAVIIEPIQCSAGDIHLSKALIKEIFNLTRAYSIPFIMDEVQVGFGTTGTLWYHEQLEFRPDFVVFGKKTQVSGFMAADHVSEIFDDSQYTRLDVTWNGDLTDMIRSKYVMKAYQDLDIMKNVLIMSDNIIKDFSKIKSIQNLRSAGLLIAFDCDSAQARNNLYKSALLQGLLINPTGEKSFRIRPPLTVSLTEAEHAYNILNNTMEKSC
jgi:L-lysine 6-transaminase